MYKKGESGFLGRKHTQEYKQKMKEAFLGEKSLNWKGDKVGYHGLHYWVRNVLGKPDKCQNCGKGGLTGRKINWANKSGEYKREITDWIRLCISCHRLFDNGKIRVV